jgi:divalent metal cation (Fe/Co/Zn/Cd) transporter
MDIRNPIGLLFTLLGILLTGAGLFGGAEATKAKTITETVNINLWWGLVLLVFGVVMLALAFRARKQD